MPPPTAIKPCATAPYSSLRHWISHRWPHCALAAPNPLLQSMHWLVPDRSSTLSHKLRLLVLQWLTTCGQQATIDGSQVISKHGAGTIVHLGGSFCPWLCMLILLRGLAALPRPYRTRLRLYTILWLCRRHKLQVLFGSYWNKQKRPDSDALFHSYEDMPREPKLILAK